MFMCHDTHRLRQQYESKYGIWIRLRSCDQHPGSRYIDDNCSYACKVCLPTGPFSSQTGELSAHEPGITRIHHGKGRCYLCVRIAKTAVIAVNMTETDGGISSGAISTARLSCPTKQGNPVHSGGAPCKQDAPSEIFIYKKTGSLRQQKAGSIHYILSTRPAPAWRWLLSQIRRCWRRPHSCLPFRSASPHRRCCGKY